MTVASPRTAHSYVYESLRSQILSGELSPGAPLVQATLARELGVSMTPIREALRDLATEGLITLLPHRGAVVTTLDLADALEINRIRLKLEPDLAAMAVEHTTDDVLRQAEEIYARMVSAAPGEWVTLNRDFHILLISSAPAPRLRGIVKSLLEAAALYVGMAVAHRRGTSPQPEHREILDAFQARDAVRVAEAVRTHVASNLKSLEDTWNDLNQERSAT